MTKLFLRGVLASVRPGRNGAGDCGATEGPDTEKVRRALPEWGQEEAPAAGRFVLILPFMQDNLSIRNNDPMELSTLVSHLVAMVAPALPYLMQKVDKAADAAVEKLGKTAWEHARGLWASLWPRIEDKQAAREAAEALATDPSDEDARGALRMTLRKLLAEDAELAQSLADLLDKARRAGVTITASGERAVAAGGDIGTVITGDQNRIGGDG